MTTEKMPDVIFARKSHTYKRSYGRWEGDLDKNIFPQDTEYYRAEPVEELLKEAKHLLDGMVNHQIYNSMICGQSNRLIAEIDKFLGDK